MLAASARNLTATTYYVSPNGTGDGSSPDAPGEIITISRKLQSNDEVRFAAGDYHLDAAKVPSGQNSYLRIPNGASNLTFLGPTDEPNDAHLIGTPSHKMRLFYFLTGGHVVRNLRMSGGYTDYQCAGVAHVDDEHDHPECLPTARGVAFVLAHDRWHGAGGAELHRRYG